MTDLTSLIVKVTTNVGAQSGTNDFIYFDIGTRQWLLRNTGKNDFEPGKTDTFVLQNLEGLSVEDIRHIRLEKHGSNSWNVHSIQVFVNNPNATGAPFYHSEIDLELHDSSPQVSGMMWQASDFPRRWPYDGTTVANGRNVSRVETRSGTVMQEVSPKVWAEIQPDGRTFHHFNERYRDDWSVIMVEGSNKRLRLDLHTKKVLFSTNTRHITDITGEFELFGGIVRSIGKIEHDDPVVNWITVKVTTGVDSDAGTDDKIYFSIGTREWRLDNQNRDDFESGQTDTFYIPTMTGRTLRMSDIQKIGLRKTGSDRWLFNNIRVWINIAPGIESFIPPTFSDAVNMSLGSDSSANNRWGLEWTSRNYPQPAASPVEDTVTALRVELETADVRWAQTRGNNIFFSIGTREWKLGSSSFSRGQKSTFDLGDLRADEQLRISDFRKIRLRKTGTDGWQPKNIKVFINNETTPFYEGDINIMLDGGSGAENGFGLSWEANDFIWEVPVHCHYIVGRSANTPFIGPMVKPRRSKLACAELINNFNTSSYRTLSGDANGYWTQGRIRYRIIDFTDAVVSDADGQLLQDDRNARGAFTDLNIPNIRTQFNVANRVNIYFARSIESGSNWALGGNNPAIFVQDTRNGATVNTKLNFRRVAVSTSHELGHYFGLPHNGGKSRLMTGTSTNETSQILTRAEADSAHANAENDAENS